LSKLSNDLTTQIGKFSNDEGKIRQNQLKAMKKRVDTDLDIFNDELTKIVATGDSQMTNTILDRNGSLYMEADGTKKSVVALRKSVLFTAATLTEKDGLVLSDRLWRISEEAKLDIAKKLQVGIISGESHTKIARDIKQYVQRGNLRFVSERLVKTEMAKAYKIANEESVKLMQAQSEFMWFEKWELSPRHPRPDVCDLQASQDNGNGPGVYKTAPRRHPGCLCLIYPVWRPKGKKEEFELVSGEKPKPDNLTPSAHKQFKELAR